MMKINTAFSKDTQSYREAQTKRTAILAASSAGDRYLGAPRKK